MEFEIRHQFNHGRELVARTILDPQYQASLSRLGPLKSRTLLSQEGQGSTVVRRIRCVLDVNFVGAAKSVIGPSDPSWVEESTWFPEEMTWRWRIVPDIAASLLSAGGTMKLSEDRRGATRVVAGEVRVHVPFVGEKVERSIVEGVTSVYNEEAERLTQWLANISG
jgi:Protein of unknown function (DUF2505)